MIWGFVGLGQMGLPMARNLARRATVVALDRRGRDFDGLTTVRDTGALAGCDVVLTCLPDAGAVEQVLLGKRGLAHRLAQGATVIDSSTTSHGTARRIGAALAERGLGFLDAPISGMAARAEDGTLTMMVGGDADLLASHRDALSTMASTVLHVGPVGAGQLAKLINQLLFDINMAALAEILPISAKLGLDPEQVTEIVNSGTGRSHASAFFLPNILQGVFDKGYPMGAAYKDLIAGAEVTAQNGFPAPVLAAATATYQQALADGFGAEDKGAMIKVFERLTGAEFRSERGKDV
ncbi:NAD(P)-dependent oxidoreductase [Jannaschia sp. S6380]|uniref:NAD(P)-dependent oxidoreductase n=1 Tax=Jannaschia sp. S6380 TaxID=2926408 RepID=UPI001FF33C3B|nr:NAD(P)-dependent oxidoreductase [Jannaschia sp. S6380]MCK0166726.1 NAD(P)-dependent oxidoreductase [Jannaschia sp. S6380]